MTSKPKDQTFSSNITQEIATDWLRVLTPQLPTIEKVIEDVYTPEDHEVLPSRENVLRAFKNPFSDVKVVIVGQDPYPTPGDAVGLAFSVSPTSRIPRSLTNIFAELHTDLGLPQPKNGDLTSWEQQGVLLLNRVLTVPAGTAGGHRKRGWEQVTEHALKALDERGGPLVVILWGNDAAKLAPLFHNAAVISSAHPSPLSARRGFFGSRPFSRANELLHEQGAAPVDWSLPASPAITTDSLF
ncbi:uracil-DNA glycosylase [Timonella sp. A28]|uniref:uracil-DNA glycosylase n=1 Tax=Timonella sp. A28 TaxID=3442640 RepID=UPI003EC016BA